MVNNNALRQARHRQRIQADPELRANANALRRERYRNQNPLPLYANMVLREGHYSQLTWNRTCQHCNCRLLQEEENTFCCGNGTKLLANYPAIPPPVQQLYAEYPNVFAQESRFLNNHFRFAVCGVHRPGQWLHLDGPSTVILLGRTYHCVFQLDQPGHFLNWLLYDQQAQHNARAPQIPGQIYDMFHQALMVHNPFVRIFATWQEEHAQQITLQLNSDPATGEVAAIWFGAPNFDAPRNLYIRRNGDGEPSYLSAMSSLLEPLAYPILFPSGEPGWYPNRLFLSGVK